MKETTFLGIPCVELSHEDITLLVTTSVGPRILALRINNRINIFAELPDLTIPNPDKEPFHFYGGHRFWYAPEIPEVTYLPDDLPVSIEDDRDVIRITQPVERETGIKKKLSIRFLEDGAVEVIHTLTNLSQIEISCAPWAISQLKTGGIAILPQPKKIPGFSDVQPNRSIILWPYTDIDDELIEIGNRYILVKASREDSLIKVGFPNPDSWLGYYLDGILFVKFAAYNPDAEYYDLNASSQCYCNHQFMELESLGEKTTILPGDSVDHREVWKVFQNVELFPGEPGAAQLASNLKLNEFATRYICNST